MHFLTLTVCVSSLLVATASASTSVSFEIPGSAPGTAVTPGVDTTTTVWETSTHYLTSAVTLTKVPVVSLSFSDTIRSSVPAETSVVTSSSCSEDLPPIETTPSLYVSGSQTLIPVTLWESSTTRVVYPQNSTALPLPTGYPANGTFVVTSSVSASKITTTPGDKTSPSVSTTASISEVPVNSANKIADNMVLGMGAVAGFMALL